MPGGVGGVDPTPRKKNTQKKHRLQGNTKEKTPKRNTDCKEKKEKPRSTNQHLTKNLAGEMLKGMEPAGSRSRPLLGLLCSM